MTDKSDDRVGHLNTFFPEGAGIHIPGGGGGMLKFRVDRRIIDHCTKTLLQVSGKLLAKLLISGAGTSTLDLWNKTCIFNRPAGKDQNTSFQMQVIFEFRLQKKHEVFPNFPVTMRVHSIKMD